MIDPEQPTSAAELESYFVKFAAGIFLRANVGDGKGPRRFSLAALDRAAPNVAEHWRQIWRARFEQTGWYPTRLLDPAGWEP